MGQKKNSRTRNIQEEPHHLEETAPQLTPEEQTRDEHELTIGNEDQQTEEEKPVVHQRKRHRGPTRMKDIAKDPNNRIKVEFTALGEPCGKGSIKLSSYLGPLVREHVPVLIDDWRNIGEERRTVLWRSVQVRFELDGEYEKAYVLKHMGCLWRASKSRLVREVRKAKNNIERMKLRPKTIPVAEWHKFVKLKTSPEFQVVSDEYKERRRKQTPHTCSRKGMVRLTEDMKKETSEPFEVTRLKVWVKSRTKKDGTPVNRDAAEKIRKAVELVDSNTPSATSSNPKEDLLAQVLGPDNPGRLRAMGRGMSRTKLACLQVNNKYMTDMQQNQVVLQQEVEELKAALAKMKSQRHEPEVGENSTPRSVKKILQRRCLLFDWSTNDKVAEGRILSSDPADFMNDIPLGPNSVKVLLDTAIILDASLWRPTPTMFTIEEAVGEIIAWHHNFCVAFDDLEPEENAPKSPITNSSNTCRLLDWATKDEEAVAIGRLQSQDPKALVHGVPIGRNAAKIFLDKVIEPDTFLWRPTAELSKLDDSFKSFVAWPVNRVVFCGVDRDTDGSASPLEQFAATPPAPVKKPQAPSHSPPPQISQNTQTTTKHLYNKKCMLMDITGKRRVVAEGRWSSNDPQQTVHFVPLGPNAVCVWIDTMKVNDAPVWRSNSVIQFMEDALGTSVAWPEDKVVIV